jgi:hypothetical protein
MAPAVNVIAARQAVRAELAQGVGPGGAGHGGVGVGMTLQDEPPFEARAPAAAACPDARPRR